MNSPKVCTHFGKCAGCLEHLTESPPSVWEEVLAFFPSLSPSLHIGSVYSWRHRAKVAVRGISKKPLIGLFKRFSHEVLPIPHCLVHHPNLNQAFEWVRLWIEKNGIVPYDEKTGDGFLRYLQGVTQRESGLVQMSFVFNISDKNTSQICHFKSLILQLKEEHPNFWHSLWINLNDLPTNTIFGKKWLFVSGKDLLWEKFGDIAVCYGPESFGQANLPLFERLLFRIKELLPPKARVTEFYAGVGVIGLFIASSCEWIRCCEVNPYAENYFKKSLSKLSAENSSRLSFFSCATKDALDLLKDATTVIVDPPRKGLDKELFTALRDVKSVSQLLYISCGWESFKKDCSQLLEDGWKVQSVDGYSFFPGSNHVELLVSFTREV